MRSLRRGIPVILAIAEARKGRAQSVMAQYCRSGEVSKRDQKECEEVLADKGETAESLQPAVVEVAKAAVAKLR